MVYQYTPCVRHHRFSIDPAVVLPYIETQLPDNVGDETGEHEDMPCFNSEFLFLPFGLSSRPHYLNSPASVWERLRGHYAAVHAPFRSRS